MRFVISAAAAVLLASTSNAPAELQFAPKTGARVEKRFTHSFEMELEKLEIWFGDEQIPSDQLGDPQVSVTSEQEIVFVDKYVALAAGRPEKLERTFDTAESKSVEKSEAEDGPGERITERESALVGMTVAFTWNAEREEFESAFVGDGGDADLLEGLREDADLRALLPAGEVEEGATWEAPVSAFDDVITPGGELTFKSEDGDESDVDDAELRENLSGKVIAKYAGQRDEGGVKVDVIELDIDVETHGDVAADESEEENEHGTQTREIVIGQKLTGELLWSRELGRAHSLTLEGTATYTMTTQSTFQTDEGEASFKQRFEFAGTSRCAVELKALDDE